LRRGGPSPCSTPTCSTRIPSGIVHINDQTVGDEAVAPFGGLGDSGTGSRLGGLGNLEAFTETQSLTIAGEVPPYPF
jgi:benzaldehyde dehydrogenase (NAD)